MESCVDQCHLLCISRELRDRIYDYVIHFDPPTGTVSHYKNSLGKAEFSTAIVKTPGTDFSIPWVNLLLTCKVICTEIIVYLDVLSRVDKEEHRTWTLDLAASRNILKPALWRQIPCHAARAEILVTNIDFGNGRTSFWGDGGPKPIVRQLYQTLNRILHYGPAFGRQVPLLQPMRLKTLVLHVATGSSVDTYHQLCSFFNILRRVGLLWGYISTVQIIDEGSHEEREIVVEFVENCRVPESWKGYGFEWGVMKNGVK